MKRTIYQQIMDSLKQVIRGRKLGYKDAAIALGLSESSVKRLFNAPDGQMSKVESLCEWLEIDLSDVLNVAMNQKESYITTPEQEAFFLKYPSAFQFFIELIEYDKSVKEIQDCYLLNDASVTFYLNRLEDVGLIEVLPGNKIKSKIKGVVSVTPSGNLAKKLLRSSIRNIEELSIQLLEKPKGEKKKATMRTGELLLSEKSFEEIMKEYEEFNDRIEKISIRDLSFYPKKELSAHLYFNAFMNHRLFVERIRNI